MLVKVCKQGNYKCNHNFREMVSYLEKLTFLSPEVIFSKDVKVATQPTGLVEVSI